MGKIYSENYPSKVQSVDFFIVYPGIPNPGGFPFNFE